MNASEDSLDEEQRQGKSPTNGETIKPARGERIKPLLRGARM
jgi:hypothetical protein